MYLMLKFTCSYFPSSLFTIFSLATRPVAKALAGQQGLRHKIKSFGNFPFLSAKLCKCSRIKYFDSPFFLVNNVFLKIEKLKKKHLEYDLGCGGIDICI